MKVFIAGDKAFVEEIASLCRRSNHDIDTLAFDHGIQLKLTAKSMRSLASAEIFIECCNRSLDEKGRLLDEIGQVIDDSAIVLTSAMISSTTRNASFLARQGQAVGYALLPPIGEEPVVELASAIQTTDAAFGKATAFWQDLKCRTVQVGDGPGLVRPRIICCLINEAASALQDGVASARDIDQAMRLGTNYPLGPLEWADQLGLDVVLGVMNGLFDEWGEDRYRPSPLLKRMVSADRLGEKSGRGFYEYL